MYPGIDLLNDVEIRDDGVGATYHTVINSSIIDMNGSTDYIEGYCYHAHGSNIDIKGHSGNRTSLYAVKVDT